MLRWAEVHLDRLLHNFRQVERLAGNKGIIAVVKANAYGHGSVQVARFLQERTSVKAFAVATYREGVELREAGVNLPVLVMSSTLEEEEGRARRYSLTPVVYDFADLKEVKRRNLPFHLKLDTGMGRLGFVPSQWEELLPEVEGAKLSGVMTHFPDADADPDFTKAQLELFFSFVRRLLKRFPKLWVHTDNSAGLALKNDSLLTHARVGLALYGVAPTPDYPADLKQVMEVKAKVLSVKELPAGWTVSYGRTYKLKEREKLAVVSFGYADGLPRELSNRGEVLLRGRRCPIRGMVCMDMTVVSADGLPVKKGETATLSDQNLTFDEIARLTGTVPYEIMCRISPRVERVYRGV